MIPRLRILTLLTSCALLPGADFSVAAFAGAKVAGVQFSYTDTIYIDIAAYNTDNYPATGFAKRVTIGVGSPLLNIGYVKKFERNKFGTSPYGNGIKISGNLPITREIMIGCYFLTSHVNYRQQNEAGFLISYHFQ